MAIRKKLKVKFWRLFFKKKPRFNHKLLLSKMNTVIKTTPVKQKAVAARYISLANRRLNQYIGSSGHAQVWFIIGASMAIEENWEDKFGIWKSESNPIFKNGNRS
jgi:hypothetical protein